MIMRADPLPPFPESYDANADRSDRADPLLAALRARGPSSTHLFPPLPS